MTGLIRHAGVHAHAVQAATRPHSAILRVLAMAIIGAAIALVVTEVVANLAAFLGMSGLHDVGVNTGPLAAVGGGAAGMGGAGTGTGPDPAGGSGTTDPGAGAAHHPDLWTDIGLIGTRIRQEAELATMRRTDPATGQLQTQTAYLEAKIEREEAAADAAREAKQRDQAQHSGTNGPPII
jgi:hypothetical protein